MVNSVPIAIVCTLVGVIIIIRLLTLHRRSIITKSSSNDTYGVRPGPGTSFLGKLSTRVLVFPHKSSDVLPRTRSDADVTLLRSQSQTMAQTQTAVPQRVASMPTLHAPRPALVLRTCSDPGRPPTPPPRFDLVGPPPPKFEEVMALDAAALRSGGRDSDPQTRIVNVVAITLPPPAYTPRV